MVLTLRVLECKAFCQIPKSAREGKFAPVSFMRVLVSYTMHNPAHRVWDTEKQKVYDVAARAFDEAAPPGWWRAPLNAAAGADADQAARLPCSPSPTRRYKCVSTSGAGGPTNKRFTARR